MIARASRKATKAGARVRFELAVAEKLPFPDDRFDVVLSTLMLHHLPRNTRQLCAFEIGRVLKPGGRVLAVDFGRARKKGLMAHFHRHGHVAIEEIMAVFGKAGLTAVSSGPVGVGDLQFVGGSRAGRDDGSEGSRAVNGQGRHSVQPWLLFVALVPLIGGPIILYHVLPLAGVPAAVASTFVVVVAFKHLGLMAVLLAPLYALLRRRPRH